MSFSPEIGRSSPRQVWFCVQWVAKGYNPTYLAVTQLELTYHLALGANSWGVALVILAKMGVHLGAQSKTRFIG